MITKNNIDFYSRKSIESKMAQVYDWQVKHPVQVNISEDWARAVLYIGAMRAYSTTKEKPYIEGSMKYSQSVNWKAGKRFRHADDLARGQAFLDIFSYKKQPEMLEGIKSRVDSIIASPKKGRDDWWWCDALFMEPPVLVRLAEQTKNKKYYQYLNDKWWDSTDYLMDKEENLYYRDKRFFEMRTSNGKKVFWSRGNGWVMGGLSQVLEHLPKTDPYHARYVELFQNMAAKIKGLQHQDGFWPASLLDPDEVPVKETSGTGFFVFALAWGINNGYLDKTEYLPTVKRGWEALWHAVEPDGKLTWVQQIGAKPESVKKDDNQEYGSGAFLMAGTELIKLKL